MGWLKSLYHWTLQQAERPRALIVLFFVSLAESSFFPVPPDVLIAPIVLARRAWWCGLVVRAQGGSTDRLTDGLDVTGRAAQPCRSESPGSHG